MTKEAILKAIKHILEKEYDILEAEMGMHPETFSIAFPAIGTHCQIWVTSKYGEGLMFMSIADTEILVVGRKSHRSIIQ